MCQGIFGSSPGVQAHGRPYSAEVKRPALQLCFLAQVLLLSSSWLVLLAMSCIRTSSHCGLEGGGCFLYLASSYWQFDFIIKSKSIRLSTRLVQSRYHGPAILTKNIFVEASILGLVWWGPGMPGRPGGVGKVIAGPGIAVRVAGRAVIRKLISQITCIQISQHGKLQFSHGWNP